LAHAGSALGHARRSRGLAPPTKVDGAMYKMWESA
jgi:hypothetical protein